MRLNIVVFIILFVSILKCKNQFKIFCNKKILFVSAKNPSRNPQILIVFIFQKIKNLTCLKSMPIKFLKISTIRNYLLML